MTDITIFDFETTAVRIVIIDDRPHWVASDIAAILGYSHTTNMVRMLDDDQKGVHLVSTLGGQQTLSVVTEGGMFTCVIRSKRPEAKRFLRWITDEVLPALRKTGTYTMPGRPSAADDLDHAESPARDHAEVPTLSTALAIVREARRLYGPKYARAIWPGLGLPTIEPEASLIDDGLPDALATWINDNGQLRTRFTYDDVGHGLGIGKPSPAAKRRIRDCLYPRGYIYKLTRIYGGLFGAWHAPVIIDQPGEEA